MYVEMIEAVSVKFNCPLQTFDLKYPKTRNNYKLCSNGSGEIDDCMIPLALPVKCDTLPPSVPSSNGTPSPHQGTNDNDGRVVRANSIPQSPPEMRGWFSKEGNSMLASWKKRYFVLKDGGMGYYGDESLAKQYGNVALSNASTEIIEVKGNKRLIISTTGGRSYKLEGPDVTVLREWMENLERHIAYATTMTLISETSSMGGGKRPSFTERSKSFFSRKSRDSFDA